MPQMFKIELPLTDELGRHIWGGDLNRVWVEMTPAVWPGAEA